MSAEGKVKLGQEIKLEEAPWLDDLERVEKWIAGLVSREADRWFREQSRNPWTRFYLYYKPATKTKPGDIRVAPDAPGPGWKLAHPQSVSRLKGPFTRRDDVWRWVWEKARRLPLLPTGGQLPSMSARAVANRYWFGPIVAKRLATRGHTGWRKRDPAAKRRRAMLRAHGGNVLAAARACQALANVTRDPETKKKARADAKYLFRLYRQRKHKR